MINTDMMMRQNQASSDKAISDMARRYDISTDAVQTLLSALRRGGGRQAQFNHPDLGGMGQWSRGGMIMIGDMFNQSLKAKVDSLCTELSAILSDDGAGPDPAKPDVATPQVNEHGQASQTQRQSQGSAGNGATDRSTNAAQDDRWPAALGRASATGSQNDMRYAVFPETRRLAIERGGRITVYDTGDYRIGGFSQQQSSDQSITFHSQQGQVSLTDLRVVEAGGTDSA